jgi:hypothetical protein
MLDNMAMTAGHESIVSWQPHGMSFRVHLPEVFASTVMPRYFTKQTKYKSFLRQLHIYGFHRIAKGRDRGAYCHDKFIRNKKSMSLQMSRQKIKGTKSSNPTNRYADGSQPDFYSLVTTIKNVDNDQYEGRRTLASGLQFNPRMLHACTTSTEKKKKGFYMHGPGTVFTDGSIQHNPDEEQEKPSLLNSAVLLNLKVEGAVPSPASHRTINGCEDIIDLAVDWLEQHGAGEHNFDGDEGLFFGKRFFHVAESEQQC